MNIVAFTRKIMGVIVLAGALALTAGAASAQSTTGNGAPAPAPAPGPHGNGPIHFNDPATTANGGCEPLQLPDPSGYANAGDGVKALSRATTAYIKECSCDTQACIANALDEYAAKLAVIAPRLPPEIRNLPSIVSQAARRVRASRSKAEAAKVLHQAVAQIHKEIELIRADDPEEMRLQTRGGDFVAGTLNFAATKLERAEGL